MPRDQAEALRATHTPALVLLSEAQAGATASAAQENGSSIGQGTLLVAAWPGDRVTINGERVTLGGQSEAVASVAEGPAIVEVLGGGRQTRMDVEVVTEHTVWITPMAPPPVELRFPLGSAEMVADQLALLQALTPLTGDAIFEIQGFASPEGDPDRNHLLAGERAAAVFAAALAGGVARDQLRLLPSVVEPEGGDPLHQRRVVVRVAGGGT